MCSNPTDKTTQKSLLITGGSSGIGASTVHLFASRGYRVFDLSRRGTVPCDVTDEDSVRKAVDKVFEQTDHIDVLILNAGFGISGAVEFTETEEVKRQMDVNFIGAVSVTKMLLPRLRRQGYGRIIFTSSVAALLPIPYQSFYSASKAAVNAFALALQNEVRAFGIRVSVFMPGDVKTGFTAARHKELRGADVYPRAAKAVENMEKDERNGLSPEEMARCLYRIATARSPRPQYTGGAEYKFFLFLRWLLPLRLVNYIVGKLY